MTGNAALASKRSTRPCRRARSSAGPARRQTRRQRPPACSASCSYSCRLDRCQKLEPTTSRPSQAARAAAPAQPPTRLRCAARTRQAGSRRRRLTAGAACAMREASGLSAGIIASPGAGVASTRNARSARDLSCSRRQCPPAPGLQHARHLGPGPGACRLPALQHPSGRVRGPGRDRPPALRQPSGRVRGSGRDRPPGWERHRAAVTSGPQADAPPGAHRDSRGHPQVPSSSSSSVPPYRDHAPILPSRQWPGTRVRARHRVPRDDRDLAL